MNKSARHEIGDYCSYEFDYQTDFTQFLEEARKNATPDTNFEKIQKKQLDHGKKNPKSLKSSLFSWLKTGKKSRSMTQLTNDTTLVLKTRLGHVSGPVKAATDRVISRARRAASGPLLGCMNSTRRPEEYEEPYMCVDQLNNPQKLQSYGPIYLVT
ncbi:hypothetical protein ACS0TY_035510 [Phlomoides rotata]